MSILSAYLGMGPQASCELYRLLIEGAGAEYGAKHNDEFPEILIDSVPVPDGFSHPEQMEVVATMLENRAERMTSYGATMISLACNTVCIYANRLRKITPIEVISTVDEVVEHVSKKHSRVLLLSSSTSLKLGLYQRAFDAVGVEYIAPGPEHYARIDKLILGVMSVTKKDYLTENIAELTKTLLHGVHVDAVVLGCTEMPLIFPKKFYVPVYSSLSILAESVLKRYYYRKETL